MRNKKGNAKTWFNSVIFLLIFGIMNIIGYGMMFAVVNGFASTTFWGPEMAEVSTNFLKALSFLDWVLVFCTIILITSTAIVSYKIKSPPIYFIVNFLMAAFYGYISYIFNYVFIQIVSNEFFSSFITLFSKTSMILTNLHWIMLAMIVISTVATYSKTDKTNYSGGYQ